MLNVTWSVSLDSALHISARLILDFFFVIPVS